jgi:hypothetical protein
MANSTAAEEQDALLNAHDSNVLRRIAEDIDSSSGSYDF